MNQLSEALEISQLWDAVCLATAPCGWCKGTLPSRTIAVCPVCGSHYCGLGHMIDHNPACSNCRERGPSPGQVWALPGMRVECPCICLTETSECHCGGGHDICARCLQHGEGRKEVSKAHGAWCTYCQGLNLVALQDLNKLLESVARRLDGHSASVEFNEHSKDASEVWLSYAGTCKSYGRYPTEAFLRAVAKALLEQGAALEGGHGWMVEL